MSKLYNLIGQRFGNLIVTEKTDNAPSGHTQWICKCDCGGHTIATTSILNSGHKVSCGCKAKLELTGNRYGKLLVIGEYPEKIVGRKKVNWECLCDCGKVIITNTANLERGLSQSCGCVRTKHNGKGTRLYRIWAGMKDRCTNINGKYWARYGGRGIMICEEWKKDFTIFRDWALSHGYEEHLTIDRIDNDKGYFPNNCQWLTLEENAGKSNR